MLELIKKNKFKYIISTLIMILPIFAGLILWDKLPDTIATHWDSKGYANGFSSKAFTVFIMPLILLGLNFICLFATLADIKNRGQSAKALNIVFWICPVISLVVFSTIYSIALGLVMNIKLITCILLGAMYIIIGNYLPKIKQNYTLGIKIPWTLNSEENWNKTHRFSGMLWVACGIIFIASAFLPQPTFLFVSIGTIIISVIFPFVYSYVYNKKHDVL